jgi:uncharacterized membrane protein YgdD (TMEM256/DUF423 family)
MSLPHRFPLFAAGAFGAIGVSLGAFGAHALRTTLTELSTRDRWETAVFYQLTHSVALLASAAYLRSAVGTSARRFMWAARCWMGGITLFSGSLYVLSLTTNAPLWFKIAVPPAGGSLLVLGWLFAVSAAYTKET